MSQWQLDCDQDISSVKAEMQKWRCTLSLLDMQIKQCLFLWGFWFAAYVSAFGKVIVACMLCHLQNTVHILFAYSMICSHSSVSVRRFLSLCAPFTLWTFDNTLFVLTLFVHLPLLIRLSSSVVLTHLSVARCGPSCCITTTTTPPPKRERPGDCKNAATIMTSSRGGGQTSRKKEIHVLVWKDLLVSDNSCATKWKLSDRYEVMPEFIWYGGNQHIVSLTETQWYPWHRETADNMAAVSAAKCSVSQTLNHMWVYCGFSSQAQSSQ